MVAAYLREDKSWIGIFFAPAFIAIIDLFDGFYFYLDIYIHLYTLYISTKWSGSIHVNLSTTASTPAMLMK